MYDHEPEEVDLLGWEEFIYRQWESIFAGYRSATGLRRMCRRWSDLIEVGLGCSQDVADQLVKAEVLDRADRDLEGTVDAEALVRGMTGVVADLRVHLPELAERTDQDPAVVLESHARLLHLIRAYACGEE